MYSGRPVMLWLLVPVALGGSPPVVHWAQLEPPAAGIQAWDLDRDSIVALGSDGSLWRHRREWKKIAPPPPELDGVPAHLAVSSEGQIWVAGDQRPFAYRFDGGWGPREALPPILEVLDIGAGPDDAVWAVGVFGWVSERTDDGWIPRTDVFQMVSDAWRLDEVVVDRAGVAWTSNESGDVLRIDAERAERPDLPAMASLDIRLDAGGRPIWVGNEPRRLDEPGFPVLADSEGWWLIDDGEVAFRGPEGRFVLPLPTTSTPAHLRGGDDWVVVEDALGRLYETRPGAAVSLRDVSTTWSIGNLGDEKGLWTGDVDGDGLDDLIRREAEGLRLLLQADLAWSDATSEWGLDLQMRGEYLALCDLDGNGQVDIVARNQEGGLAYLRAQRGFFADASDTISAPLPLPVSVGIGRIDCVDVDGDADLDVVLSGAGIRLGNGPQVALYENVGFGQLSSVALPLRGLGASGWPQQVLFDDLDGDELVDALLLQRWDQGFQLISGGGARDATPHSALGSVFADVERGWLTRVDDDAFPDLISLDQRSGPRVWRGSEELRFDDHTEAWNMGLFPDTDLEMTHRAVLVDLDGDGHSDLISGSHRQGLALGMGTAAGFVDRTDTLPRTTGMRDLVALDLGGDGDQDLLVVLDGPDLLLENLGAPTAAAPVVTSSPIWRRLAWLRPWPDVPLLLLAVAPWLLGGTLVRRAGSRLVLGRAGVGLLVAGGAAVGVLATVELLPAWRWGLVAAGALFASVVSPAEIAVSRQRAARLIAGYRLLNSLGRGGMGTVYRALEPKTGREVALKLMHPDLLSRDEDRALFRREAEVGASLIDPRVVRLLGFGEWVLLDGPRKMPTAYLVMELLHGSTARTLLEQGPLAPGAACALAREVALALHTVHSAGIVHRDVKPENIMVVPGGGVKLMDFGAARQVGHATQDTAKVLGTVGYLSPEQWRGKPPDPRSDLYALGVVLFELINEQRPFHGEDLVEVLSSVLHKPTPELTGVAPELAAVVASALCKDPEERPPNALALAAALEPFATQVPDVGSPLTLGNPLPSSGWISRLKSWRSGTPAQPQPTATALDWHVDDSDEP